jgi:hypothetical protein
MAIIMGDSGPSPTYHAGWMVLYSLIYLFLFFIYELLTVPPVAIRAPKVHLAFLAWMLVGSLILCLIENQNPGKCCSEPAIRSQIGAFSLYWPLLFWIGTIVRCAVETSKKTGKPL